MGDLILIFTTEMKLENGEPLTTEETKEVFREIEGYKDMRKNLQELYNTGKLGDSEDIIIRSILDGDYYSDLLSFLTSD